MAADLVTEAVRSALASKALLVAYQPICGLRQERTVIWWEALVRCDGPDGEAIPPAQIVRIARRLHLLDELTDQVTTQAFDLLIKVKEITGGSRTGRGFSVNFEADQLGSWTPVLDALVQRSRETGIEVMVEVTERVLDAWTDLHSATIDRLRSAGISVAIDDFGTGYAALGSLFRVPADTIKIDRSMVDSLSDRRQLLLLERISSVLHELGFTVVVEGVLRREDLAILAQLGVEQVQGHLMAEPKTAEEMIDWANLQ